MKENSTSMLIQNTRFLGIGVAVQESASKQTLIGGGLPIPVGSWGFGNMVARESGKSSFQNGVNIPAANRTKGLTNPSDPFFFSRSAPTYKDVSSAKFINIKSMGARGDGKTDDVAIINQILDYAANISSVVIFPYGEYVVSNTVKIPAGSRIVGQAWTAGENHAIFHHGSEYWLKERLQITTLILPNRHKLTFTPDEVRDTK